MSPAGNQVLSMSRGTASPGSMSHSFISPGGIVPFAHRAGVLAAVLVSFWPLAAAAQRSPQETAESLAVPEGFEVKLFASEPLIANPIALDVDTHGRVWVTEGVNYRRNVAHPPDNKIKVLEDTDGDGVADKMTVFASDLNAAMGICVAGTSVYVPESPNLYVYEDLDGDLKADGPRKIVLKGFGGQNHDHGTHGQLFGPDHKLYMTQGDTGYDVTGPDGRRVAYRWGGLLRCEADGTQLEDFAVNFRNPFELAIDSFGNVWCSDNDNDGLNSVRICWILEGGNYGWFGSPEMIRAPDGSFDPVHHWRADRPGFVPYALITGFGAPCGMTFYEGSAFGPKLENTILHCDAGPRELRRYAPRRTNGAGYTVAAESLMTSPDNYFRPDDVCVAPDGSFYVNDWYDGGVGGHAYNDPQRGRIYRVVPAGKKLERREKPGPYTQDDDALVALASPNPATAHLARERLLASGPRAISGLEFLVAGENRNLRARALWLLDRIGGLGREAVRGQLKSADPAFRGLAVRILRRHAAEVEQEILDLVDDPDGEVLKEVLLAIARLKSRSATEALLKLFGRYDGTDRYFLEALHIAARGREAEIFKAVVARPDASIDQRLVNLARILRAEDATPFLAGKLASADLSQAVQTALITALSSIDAPDAGRSVAAVLTRRAPIEIKRMSLDALRRNLSRSWSSLKNDPDVTAALTAGLADESLAVDALATIGAAGLTQFDDAITAILADSRATGPVQLAAIGISSQFSLDAARPQLAVLLTSREPSIREASLRALVALRDTKTLGKLLSAGETSLAVKQRIVDLLIQSSGGAVFLLRLLDTGKLDQTLAGRVVSAAIEHPDVTVRLLFKKFTPDAKRPKPLGQEFKVDDILKLKGDEARGESVFLRSEAASCSKCHRVNGKGVDTGPDLSQIGRKYERRALLDSIIYPSAGIAPEYVPYVVETDSGKVFAGFLQQQTEREVVLKAIDGSSLKIPRKNVVEIVKQNISLMPELALKNVTAQDAADLLAYLVGLQTVQVHALRFKVLGPFPNVKPEDRGTDFGPEKSAGEIDFKATFPVPGGATVGWSTATAQMADGGEPAVDLIQVAAVLKAPAEQVIYYFAATLDSSSEQPATLRLGSDDGLQIWLNGQRVYDASVTRSLKPGEDQVQVNLKPRRNLLLLKLDQGNGPGGFALSAEARGNLTFGVPP